MSHRHTPSLSPALTDRSAWPRRRRSPPPTTHRRTFHPACPAAPHRSPLRPAHCRRPMRAPRSPCPATRPPADRHRRQFRRNCRPTRAESICRRAAPRRHPVRRHTSSPLSHHRHAAPRPPHDASCRPHQLCGAHTPVTAMDEKCICCVWDNVKCSRKLE